MSALRYNVGNVIRHVHLDEGVAPSRLPGWHPHNAQTLGSIEGTLIRGASGIPEDQRYREANREKAREAVRACRARKKAA